MIPNNLKSRRRSPSARSVKKHSDYAADHTTTVVVGGARVKTKTGYRVPGFVGKSFETFYEVLLAGTSTPVMRHEKKDRTYRVLSGTGFVIVDGTERRVFPGDEVACERGSEYRVATSNEKLELFVCQQAKYEVNLEVGEDVVAPAVVPASMLQTPSFNDRMLSMRPAEASQPPRRGSKAKLQMRKARGDRTSPQVVNNAASGAAAPEFAPTTQGVNVKPTGGRFDDAGAG